jgi:hypothetical protein
MFHDLAHLDADWRRVADSAEANAACVRWALTSPALHGLDSLDGVLERRLDPAEAPAVLSALADLAPTDGIAARTLLQALVPGLLRLAGTVGYDDPTVMTEMLSLAWERIRTYPPTRTGSVAGNVLLDVRKDYRCHRDFGAARTSIELIDSSILHGSVPSAEDEAVSRLAFAELVATHRKAVGERGHQAVLRTEVYGFSVTELAAEENVRAHTVAQRKVDARTRFHRVLLAK